MSTAADARGISAAQGGPSAAGARDAGASVAAPEEGSPGGAAVDPGDLSDLLEEVRILQQGAQVLTAFLVIVPFSAGFPKIVQAERWIFVGTFVCALTSLVFLSAPAAQHRLERPLADRVRFKRDATRLVVVGAATLSLALVLAALLVVTEVLGRAAGQTVAGLAALLVGTVWWAVPLRRRGRPRPPADGVR